jgi:hypothetical protein
MSAISLYSPGAEHPRGAGAAAEEPARRAALPSPGRGGVWAAPDGAPDEGELRQLRAELAGGWAREQATPRLRARSGCARAHRGVPACACVRAVCDAAHVIEVQELQARVAMTSKDNLELAAKNQAMQEQLTRAGAREAGYQVRSVPPAGRALNPERYSRGNSRGDGRERGGAARHARQQPPRLLAMTASSRWLRPRCAVAPLRRWRPRRR